jgi:hypothetical protein
MIFVALFFFSLLKQVSAGKLGSTLLTHTPLLTLSDEMTVQLHYQHVPHRLRQLISSPYILIAQEVAEGYVAAFNPDYLFFEGSNNNWHNLRSLGLGNINPALLPFIVTGVWLLLTKLKERSSQWLLGYLLLSPIPDALTIDAPLTNRLLDFHFGLTLIAALGGWWWWQMLLRPRMLTKVVAVGLFAVMGWWWSVFAFRYYLLHTPLLHPDWSQGLAQTMKQVAPLAEQYDAVIIDPTGVDVYPKVETAYIYLAFFGKLDPHLLQTASWETNGYHRLDQIGKYRFEELPGDDTLTLEIPHDPNKIGKVLHVHLTDKLAPINKKRIFSVPLSIHQVAWEVEEHVYYEPVPVSIRADQK